MISEDQTFELDIEQLFAQGLRLYRSILCPACKMHYAIIANSISGTMPLSKKLAILDESRQILNAKIHGLDTRTPGELAQCARKIAASCDVLVVAGGDGSFSVIINSVDTTRIPIAFLPLGTGNALRYALGYEGGPEDIARRIKHGKIHELDLLGCGENKRGFMMSVGIEGTVIQMYNRYLSRGHGGFCAYLAGFIKAYFREYRRTNARITVDNETFRVKNLLSLMVAKQPYYGFGMKVVPMATFNDGLVHTLSVNSGFFGCAVGAVTSFTGGNQIGQHVAGRQALVRLETPLPLQIDGDLVSHNDVFSFSVLPKALRIKY
ncbi:MAG: hypothetical protein BBJ60_05660 [Desulfobacterales bacterium S7086C20]|nr:MAG: hypothetical protein BBJ60_05660 [Desulfobacterales bacterium S7086C20]